MSTSITQPTDLSPDDRVLRQRPDPAGLLCFFCSLCMAGLPVIVFRRTIDPALAPQFTALAIWLTVVMTILILQKRSLVFWPETWSLRDPVTLALLSYLAVATLSLGSVINQGEAVFEYLKSLLLLSFYGVAVALFTWRGSCFDTVARAVVAAGALQAGIGLLQFYHLGFGWIPGNGVLHGTMVHKNLYASALFLTLPFTVWTWLYARGFWKWLSACSGLLTLYMILISQTRSVYLSLFASLAAGLALAVGYRWRTEGRLLGGLFNARRLLVSLVVIGVLGAAMLSLVTQQRTTRGDGPTIPINLSTESMQERWVLWSNTSSMALEHPLMGVGMGQWKIHNPRYGMEPLRSARGDVLYARPHNDFLWVWSETGPLGLLTWLGVLAFGIGRAWRVYFSTSEVRDRGLALLLICGVCGYAADACFSFPRERIVHSVYLMLMLATVVTLHRRHFPNPKRPARALAGVLAVAALISAAASLALGYIKVRSEIHTKGAVAAGMQNEWERVISEVDSATTPWVTLDPTGTPIVRLKGIALFEQSDYEGALKCFQTAYGQNPHHLQVLDHLSTCHAALGNLPAAIEFGEKALGLSPLYENTLLNMAAVYGTLGDTTTARSYLARIQGVPADPRYRQLTKALGRPDTR